tara:strand:+ start:53 stop:1324 length:1272 start_codon:yes stop_codon:yes gene_type:complete
MSNKITPSLSDEEFNKAMNFGNTSTNSGTKKNSTKKENLNTNNNTNVKEKTINSVLNNKKDINISELDVQDLRKMKNDSNNMLSENETEPLNTNIKDKLKTTGSKLKNAKDNIKDKSSNTLGKLVGRIKETPEAKKTRLLEKKKKKEKKKERRELRKKEGKSNTGSLIQILLILIVVLALSYSVYYYFNNILNDTTYGIHLIEGVRDGKQPLVIAQDKNNPNYIPINKSFNLEGGAQFTYSFWFSISDMEYKKGEWKDMWYKGDKNKYNQGPGVFIHPNSNKIRINMNVIKQQAKTQEDTLEYIDIDNIPIGVWINLVMVFTEDKKSNNPNNKKKRYKNCLDIYINGLLKTRKELTSVPLFNTHPVWINMNGGFDGVLGNLEYFPRALETTEIHKILKKCPGESQCGKQLDCPPYLSNKWWFN